MNNTLLIKPFEFEIEESNGYLSYCFLPYKSRQNSVCFLLLESEFVSRQGHLNEITTLLLEFLCLMFKRQTKLKQI